MIVVQCNMHDLRDTIAIAICDIICCFPIIAESEIIDNQIYWTERQRI